jgi:hypothetical protein
MISGNTRAKEISHTAIKERVSQPALKKTDQSKTKKRARLTQKAIVSTAAELFAGWGFGATSLDDIPATDRKIASRNRAPCGCRSGSLSGNDRVLPGAAPPDRTLCQRDSLAQESV